MIVIVTIVKPIVSNTVVQVEIVQLAHDVSYILLEDSF